MLAKPRCPYCGQEFDTLNMALAHLDSHHAAPAPAVQPGENRQPTPDDETADPAATVEGSG